MIVEALIAIGKSRENWGNTAASAEVLPFRLSSGVRNYLCFIDLEAIVQVFEIHDFFIAICSIILNYVHSLAQSDSHAQN
jgi:hypothetical protein